MTIVFCSLSVFFLCKNIPFIKMLRWKQPAGPGADLPSTRMFRLQASRCKCHVTFYCVMCVSEASNWF